LRAPEDVAAALAPYVAVGCRRFNFVRRSRDIEAAIAAVGDVKRLMHRSGA